MHNKKFTSFLFILFGIGVSFFLGSLIGKCEQRFTPGEQAVILAVKKVKPAVVRIQTYSGNYSNLPLEIGTGVIFRSDGYILTNAHVLRGAYRIEVYTANGKRYDAALVAPSDEYDLAVLKIPAQNLPTVQFGNSDDLELGQTAIAIGNPLSFGWTVTKGVVSALNRDVLVQSQHRAYHHLIQTDAAINLGNSGGPLVDTQGNVIGINTLVWGGGNFNAQGLGFAIPSNTAKKIANELLHMGNIPQFKPRVRLGLSVYDLTETLAQELNLPVIRGAVVESVEPGSPAQKAGLRAGDVITKIDNTEIRNSDELIAYVRQKSPGAVIRVEAWRGGVKRSFIIKLERAIEEPQNP
jgi:serine protease Do